MERRVVQIRCAVWGGVSLGVGTLAYAFCSSSSMGCATNLVVLTRGAVTARGCAAFSVIAHVGIGCMVLGAVLLLGSFVLIARTWHRAPVAAEPAPAVTGRDGGLRAHTCSAVDSGFGAHSP